MKIRLFARHKIKGIPAALLFALSAMSVEAQTQWQAFSGGTYSWGDAANWSTGTIPGGMSQSAAFSVGPFQDQIINLDAVRTLGTLTFSNSTSSFLFAGNTLSLDNGDEGASIINNGVRTNGIASLVSLVDFQNTMNVADGRLILSGVISGANELIKEGTGTLILSPSGNNTYTGVTTLNNGITLALPQGNNINILGANAAGQHTVINAGATFATSNDLDNNTVGSQTTGGWGTINEAFTIHGNGYLGMGAIRKMMGREQDTLGGAVTLGSNSRVHSDSGTLAFTGTFALGTNNLQISGGSFVTLSGPVTGSGTITRHGIGGFRLQGITAANTFSGEIVSNLGEVRADTNDVTTGANPYDNVSAMTIRNGLLSIIAHGSLITAQNRVPDALPISLQAGRIRIENVSFNGTNTWAWSETIGPVTSVLGHTLLDFRDTSADSGTRVLRIASFTRSSPSVTLAFGGDGVVAANIGTGALGNRYRFFNTALDTGANTPFIGGWAYMNAEFVKYNDASLGGNGYRALEASDYQTNTAESGWNASQNIKITTTGTTTITANRTIQSLNMQDGTGRTLTGNAGTTLTIESGGLLTSGGTHTISVPFLTAGASADYHLYDIAWAGNAIRSVVTDNGLNPVSFVKTGGGTSSFFSGNTYTGTTFIHEGGFREIIGTRNLTALGAGNLTFSGSPSNQGWYETDRNFTRPLGAGAGEVQIVSGTGSGFSAYGAPVNVNFGGVGGTITWGSTHFNPGIFTLNGGNATHVVTLAHDLDLNGEQRYIRLDGGASAGIRGVMGTITGQISNGGIVRRGAGMLFFDDAKSYTGGTNIQEGELWLRNGTGTAGANVSGNDILIGGASRLKIDAPSSIGSRQWIVIQNTDDNNASAITFGPGYGNGSGITIHGRVAANSGNVVPQTGAYDVFLANEQRSDSRRNRVAVQISGIHDFSANLPGQIKTVSPDVEAWFGADTGNGTYVGSTLTATGRTKTGSLQAFRLGSGGGTITIANANVLDGNFPLVVGAEDQNGRVNIGGVVYLPKAQNYSGTVTQNVGTNVTTGNLIGSGGILVVGENGALNNSNNTVLLRGGELRLGINPAASFLGGVDTQYAARNLEVRNATGTLRTIPITGGSNGVLKMNNFTMRMDDADRTFQLLSIGTHFTAVHFDGALELQNAASATARVANFNVGNDNTFSSGLGLLVFNSALTQTATGAGVIHLQKNNGGVLVLNADNVYGGETRVSQGRLVLGHVGAAGNAGSTILMNTSGDRRSDVEFRLDGTGPFTVNNTINITSGNDGSQRMITVGSMNGSSSGNEVRIAGLISNAGTTNNAAPVTGNNASSIWFDGFNGYSLTVTGATTLTRTITDFRPRGALLTLEGAVGGAGALNKYEQGTMILAGNNTYTGTTAVYGGYLVLQNNAALGNATSAVTFNGGSFGQILASGVRTISRDFTNSATGSTQTLGGVDAGAKSFTGNVTLTRGLNFYSVSGGDVTFSGIISAAGGINKVGTGTVVLSNANSYSGGTTVSNGTLVGVAQSSGSPFGSASGALTLVNGNLVLQGIAGATTTTTGALTVNGGNVTVGVNAPAGNTNLRFGSLTRSNNATLVFKGGNTNIGAPTSEIVSFTSSPSLTHGIIGTWAVVGGPGTSDNSAHYAGISGGNVVTATYTGTGDLDGISGPTAVWNAGATASTLTANRSGYAFRTEANVNLNGNTLTLGTGGQAGIILNNGADVTGGVVSIGSNALNIYTDNAATSTWNADIRNYRNNANNTLGSGDPVVPSAAALVKFGPGTLEIANAGSFEGNIQVNQGTLSLTAANVIPTFENLNAITGSIVTIRPGATVALNGNNQEFSNLTGSVVVSPVQNTGGILDLGGATLTVGRQGSNALYSGQLIGGAGSRLVKIGGGRLTLDNWDASRPNSLETLEVLQGVATSLASANGWGRATGYVNSLPGSTNIVLRGGEWEVRVLGDGTGNFELITLGNNILHQAGDSVLDVGRAGQSGASNKIVTLGTLTLDKQRFLVAGDNGNYPRFEGAITLTANSRVQTDAPLLLNGPISGDFTFTKTGGSNLEINSDNSAWNGGMVATDGTILFGTRLPEVAERYMAGTNVFSYSSTANLGTGDIVINRGTAIRLNTPNNVLSAQGQRVQTFSSMQLGYARVDLGLDAPVTDYNIRSTSNGALTIGLNDGLYTHELDQSMLGNGRWALGAWATTFYTPKKLGAGADSVFRFAGTNSGTFNITQAHALTGPATLQVGADMVPNGFAITNGNTSVQFYGDQSYTGNTIIYRNRESGSVQNFLTIHADLVSPVIDVYGRLMARGAGRFTNDAGAQVNTVNLHPGSILRLDYNMDVNDSMATSRLENSNLGLGATENKWSDDEPLVLNGATVNLISHSGRVNRERVGGITAKGGAAVLLERNGTNGQIILETPSITRVGQATFDVRENADELGRVELQSQKFFIDNGASMLDAQAMMPAWMINPTRLQFLTYNENLGVQNRAFTTQFTTGDAAAAATFLNGLTSSSIARFAGGQGDPTLTGTVNVHAIRFDANADNETTLTGGQINIHSGGLIAGNNNAAGRVNFNTTNVYFGNGSTPVEGVIYSGGNQITTRFGGVVTANNLTLNGPGQVQLTNTANQISGNIQMNGGRLFLDGVGTAGTGTTITMTGNYVQNNDGNQMAELNLRTANVSAVWTNPIIVAENVPYVRVIGGATDGSSLVTARDLTIPSLTIEGTNTLQGTSFVFGTTSNTNNANNYNLIVSGDTSFGGTAPVGVRVERGGTNIQGAGGFLTLAGALTSSAPITKSGDGYLVLQADNASTLTSPVTLNRGFIRGQGNNNNNFFGTGDYILNFGSIEIFRNGAGTYFAAAGQDLFVNGAVTIGSNRNGGTPAAAANYTFGVNNGDNTIVTSNGANLRFNAASFGDDFILESRLIVNDSASIYLDNNEVFLRDQLVGGGRLTKLGIWHMYFDNNAANADWTGTLDIQSGTIRMLQSNATLGGTGSSIILHPAAQLSLRTLTNLGTGNGITELRTTSSTSFPVLGIALNTAATNAEFTALRNHYNSLATIGNRNGVLAIDAGQTVSVDPAMASFQNGNWQLGGGTGSGTLSANSVAPWGPGGNKFLIGGGAGTITLNPATVGAQFAGDNQMLLGSPLTVFGHGQATFGANSNNSYTGGTFVSMSRNMDGTYRGMILAVQAGQANATTYRTPLGTGAVDVFGEVRIEGSNGTARNADDANANVWVFHPGSRLRFDNGTAFGTAGTQGRWADNVGIDLNTSVLELYGAGSANVYNTETVGPISVAGGSEVVVRRRGAFLSEFIAGDLSRVGKGTLTLLGMETDTNTNTGLGASGSTSAMRFTVTNGATLMNNGMVDPWIIGRLGGNFLRYDSTLGFQPLTTANTSNYIVSTAGTINSSVLPLNNGTEILSLEATSAVTLGMNLDVYALRISRQINASIDKSLDGSANSITIRSGGLSIAQTGGTNRNPTINADLYFGLNGASDALVFNENDVVGQINGKIFAQNFIKSGPGEIQIRSNQPQFAGDWIVNGGILRFNTPGAPSTGEVILNGSRMNDRDNTYNITEVRYAFNSGSPDLFTWNGGKITAYNQNRVYAVTATDRLQQLPAIDLRTTNTTPGVGQPGLILLQADGSRTTVRTGTVTLYDHYQLHVESGSFGTGSTTGFQLGSGSGVGGLNNGGQFDMRKVGDGVLTLGDISGSFTGVGRSITIGEGAVRVLHNGSFGSADVTANIEQGGALEIAVAGWNPIAGLVQQPGSMERWAVDGARSGDIALPSGVHLQIMSNQTGSKVITMNGGSIMGYQPRDWDQVGVIHTLASGITIQLNANSYLGQPFVSSSNSSWDTGRLYDIGKFNQTTANNPNDPGLRGSYLQIDGVITGVGGLTKIGQDMILLNGANTYEGATIIENGVLQIGRNNALPVGTDLSTETSSGMFDLNGFNQEVASLSGDQGSIDNGAFALNTLTLNQTVNTTYGGQVNGNVSVVMNNTGSLTLTGNNGMRGDLVINNGSVILTGVGSVNEARSIQIGAGKVFNVNAVSGGVYAYDGKVSGGGVGALRADNGSRAQIIGSLSVQDGVGSIARQGSMSPGSNGVGHIQVTGDLTLAGGLWGTTTKAERLTLELAAPTSTLAALGWDGSNVTDWLVNSSPDVLNGLAGDVSGHDYVNVGGEVTLNANGSIGVVLVDGYQPQYGDVFNLMDWTTVSAGSFNVGPSVRSGGELGYDLNLPDLTAFQLTWHTDLFATHGVIFVVPEPGRFMLLLLGVMGLLFRRRRA